MSDDDFEMQLFNKATKIIELFERMSPEEKSDYIIRNASNYDAIFGVWLEENGFGWTPLKITGELSKMTLNKILALPCHDREDADVAKQLVNAAQKKL